MNITVYCGASTGFSDHYTRLTRALGDWIAQQGHTLVYGGGKVGLMGLIADTVLLQGQAAIGVMPHFLVDRELAHPALTRMELVNNMHERKMRMIELGDAYIALPGGPGTLEEITEVISWSRIGEHRKPCVLLNTTGFFDPLKQQYRTMVEEGFLSQDFLDTLLFAEQLEQLAPFIQSYQPPAIRTYK